MGLPPHTMVLPPSGPASGSLAELLPAPLAARAAAMGVDAKLTAMLDEARAALPQLAFRREELAAYVLERVPEGVDVGAHLDTMRAPDLLLALACARGDASAIAIFEQRYFDEVPFAHARVRPRASVDEVRQMMRDRLFVPHDGAPPRIAQYAGTGDVRGWFRVGLVRHLLNLATRAPRESELNDAMLQAIPGLAADPELEAARSLYAPALEEALVDGLAKLERRDRTLLRLSACDGLTVDAIGELYGVHRATAARWVAAARAQLETNVREGLRLRIGAGDESLASIMRLLASQVDISLRAHLVTSERSTK